MREHKLASDRLSATGHESPGCLLEPLLSLLCDEHDMIGAADTMNAS